MRLKYRVVVTLFSLSLALGLGGYATGFAYVALAGLILFILSFPTMLNSDKNDRSIVSILLDGIFFGIL